MKNNFFGKSFVTVVNLTLKDVELLFRKTDMMKKNVINNCQIKSAKGKIMAALFYEPSSRTFSSFISAMQRLGGGVIPLNGMGATSVAKGETIEDTAQVFSSYADIIAIRHSTKGIVKQFSDFSTVPVINAGDGIGEHPTQALLDSYTISKHFDNFSQLTVGLVGDLLNGRTVHSLSQTLLLLGVKRFIFVSPKELKMPKDICQKIRASGAEIQETETLTNSIGEMDVIYDTRVQKERFTDLAKYEKLKLAYIIDKIMMDKAKTKAVLMHPLPRVGEIDPEVDSDDRAIYLREQMRNGMYVRMALIDLILNK